MEEKNMSKDNFSLVRVLKALLIVFILFLILLLLIPHRCPTRKDAERIICSSHLDYLMFRFDVYETEHSRYPVSIEWSDSIKVYVDEESYDCFQCPSDPNGPCSYAMNENIPADANELPPDLVMLFESTLGWNQTGGSDDVVVDRHKKKDKPGANIAFADGHVEFVEIEDILNLSWTVEE